MIARAALVAALMMPAGTPITTLGGYRASSSSSGIELLYNDGSEADVTVPLATSSAATGTAHALAAPIYPGPVGGNPGATLKQFLGSHLPPQLADALGTLNYPFKAETYASGPNDSTLPPGVSAHTEADASHTTSSVVYADTTTTSSTDVGAGSVTTTARSTVTDLSVAGMIHIGEVTSTATASSDGTAGKAVGSTTITGLSIAGIQVSIDPHSLTLGTTKVPVDLGGLLNPVIKALGFQLFIGPEVHTATGAKVFEQAPALTLSVAPPQNGGNTFLMTLGGAVAQAQASLGFEAPVAPSVSATPPSSNPVVLAPSGASPIPDVTTPNAVPSSAPTLPPAEAIAGLPAATETQKSKPLPVGLVLLGLGVGAAGAFGLAKVRDDVLEKPAGGACPLGGNDG